MYLLFFPTSNITCRELKRKDVGCEGITNFLYFPVISQPFFSSLSSCIIITIFMPSSSSSSSLTVLFLSVSLLVNLILAVIHEREGDSSRTVISSVLIRGMECHAYQACNFFFSRPTSSQSFFSFFIQYLSLSDVGFAARLVPVFTMIIYLNLYQSLRFFFPVFSDSVSLQSVSLSVL